MLVPHWDNVAVSQKANIILPYNLVSQLLIIHQVSFKLCQQEYLVQLSIVPQSTPSTWEVNQEDQEFNLISSHMVTSKPVLAA